MKKSKWIRHTIQIAVFTLVFLIAIAKWLAEKGTVIPFISSASLHAICPFGGVETLYTFFTTGDFVQKIHESSFILMILGVIAALLFGAVFCGYICPFGSFQEWIGKLGKKLFPNRYNRLIPRKIDRILRYLRYVVLILVIYQTATTVKLLFQNVDPYYALFNFFTGEVAVSAYIILGVTVLLSLFVERPWCKYFCPYGAFLGLFNGIRIFKIRRQDRTCIHCKKCDRECPMNIEISDKDAVRNHQCISCHQCTSEAACPVKNTVVITGQKKEFTHKVKPYFAALIVIGVFAAGIIVSSAMGYWKTESSKTPSKLEGVSTGNVNDPADIRGSYTFDEISRLYDIPLKDLTAAFHLREDEAESTKCKDLGTIFADSPNEVGTSSVRMFVSYYNGLHYEPAEETYLPETAVTILKERGNLSSDQLEYLEKHTVQ